MTDFNKRIMICLVNKAESKIDNTPNKICQEVSNRGCFNGKCMSLGFVVFLLYP